MRLVRPKPVGRGLAPAAENDRLPNLYALSFLTAAPCHLTSRREVNGYAQNVRCHVGIPALWCRILSKAQNVRLQRMGHTAPIASAQDDAKIAATHEITNYLVGRSLIARKITVYKTG